MSSLLYKAGLALQAENVRLRASKAELLGALKELAECSPCQNGCDPADMTCASNKARVAIANAERGP